MAAVLRIGSTAHDLYFAGGLDLGSHLRDVPELNPATIFTALPRPPLPDFPDPKLNRVVWPVTGLSHYAYGHVLVANDTAATSGTACTLELTDGETDTARSLSLVILNRRPLSDTRTSLATSPDGAVEDPFDGWVLTLVDARYQRRKVVAAGDTIARSTWGELINSLGTAAGFTMPSASTIQALVHADFGTPDSTAWSPATLAGEGYSVAADAAALAVGLRLVVATDGTVTAQTPAASGTAYTSWLAATGRDEFTAGGVSEDRYAAPRNVQCNGTDVAMPSPTTRLDDRDYADLRSTASAFRTRWVQTYSDWLAATFVTADVRGFVLPPVCGVVQHVEYDLPACFTRVVKHPARYPLPLLKRDEAAGGTSLDTRNSDNSDIVTATTRITASLVDGAEFEASGTQTTLKPRDASPTQKGMVTTTTQEFAGSKAVLGQMSAVTSNEAVSLFLGGGSSTGLFIQESSGTPLSENPTYDVLGNIITGAQVGIIASSNFAYVGPDITKPGIDITANALTFYVGAYDTDVPGVFPLGACIAAGSAKYPYGRFGVVRYDMVHRLLQGVDGSVGTLGNASVVGGIIVDIVPGTAPTFSFNPTTGVLSWSIGEYNGTVTLCPCSTGAALTGATDVSAEPLGDITADIDPDPETL